MRTLAIVFFLNKNGKSRAIDGITYCDNGNHSVKCWNGSQRKQFKNEDLWDAKIYLANQVQKLLDKGWIIS